MNDIAGSNKKKPGNIKIGMNSEAATAISAIREAVTQTVAKIDGVAALKFNLGAGAVIGSVDVVAAVTKGTSADVAVQSSGLAGSLGGAYLGAETLGAFGGFVGPVGAGIGAVVGAGLGAYWGEKALEKAMAGVLSSPNTSNTDLLRELNALSDRLSTKPDPGNPPSHKNSAADPGGFGLGPGAKYGGNSNGFGASSPASPSSKSNAADPGGFGLGPGSQFGGNSNGYGSSKTGAHPQKDKDQDPGSGGNRSSGFNGPAGGNGTGPGPGEGFNSGTKSSAPSSGSGGISKSQQNHYDHVNAGQKLGLPILLDLDGNGVKVSELSRSTKFIDAGGDGLSHRTAWAGAGDGVLFFDPDGRNAITEKRQYVFTEWDPTAKSDMEALRSYFDSNGDGKLTSADAAFAQFKVLVTNADGSGACSTGLSAGSNFVPPSRSPGGNYSNFNERLDGFHELPFGESFSDSRGVRLNCHRGKCPDNVQSLGKAGACEKGGSLAGN